MTELTAGSPTPFSAFDESAVWGFAPTDSDKTLGSATLHEAANRTGDLPGAIKPLHPRFSVWGPAYPVACTPGHNLWLHRAVYSAPPRSILVVDVGSGYDYGYWGEILSVAAQSQNLGGLVINGNVRDLVQTVALGFPVFARGLCIRGTGKDMLGAGSMGQPICIGHTSVRVGDLVVGDADGVVVIPARDMGTVIAAGHDREAREADYMRRLRAGERTLDIYGLEHTP